MLTKEEMQIVREFEDAVFTQRHADYRTKAYDAAVNTILRLAPFIVEILEKE